MVKRILRLTIASVVVAVACMVAFGVEGLATPSTEFWTPCILDVQAPGVAHLTYDTYSSHRGDFSTDLGLTYGVRLSKQVNAEVGFDWLSRVQYPIYLDAKIGVSENVLSKGAPGFSVGIFNAGTKKSDAAAGIVGTNQDVVDLIVGKTVAKNLRVHAGYYRGNKTLLVSSTGSKQNDGLMFAFDYGFKPTKEGYNKYSVIGDYMSGKNVLGGGGIGFGYAISPKAGIITGPVWFNDQGLNGKVKLTMQLDINF